MNPEIFHKNFELNQDTGKKNIERIEKEINQFKETVVSKFDGQNREKILNALELMLDIHSEQKDRLDGKPYIIHPLEVADDLINKYGIEDCDLIISALLHDSIEDQARKILSRELSAEDLVKMNDGELKNSALAMIGNLYGERVMNTLKGLTNLDFGKIREELKQEGIQKKKKQLYKEHVAEAIVNPDVFTVKLSDFLRNASNIPSDDFKNKYFTKKYGPVIRDIFIPALEDMPESHPLHKKRDYILAILKDIYETKYKAGLEEINKTRNENEQY